MTNIRYRIKNIYKKPNISLYTHPKSSPIILSLIHNMTIQTQTS